MARGFSDLLLYSPPSLTNTCKYFTFHKDEYFKYKNISLPPDLLGGGGAEPVLHLAVPVLITAGPTVLVAVTEVPAL